jgi:hypothetical protein
MVPLFSREDLISVYTRDDAIRDGEIVDISEMARECGFTVPVGVTRAVWAIIEKKPAIQDVKGRIWDLLWILKLRVKNASYNDTVYFTVIMQSGRQKRQSFKATIAASDPTGNPAITIMKIGED